MQDLRSNERLQLRGIFRTQPLIARFRFGVAPNETGPAAGNKLALMNSRGESILSGRCGCELL
jgi:hypothetical protein